MKISYLSGAAAVLVLALTQTSGASTLTLTGIASGGTISSVIVDSAGNVTVTGTTSTTSTTSEPAPLTTNVTIVNAPSTDPTCPAIPAGLTVRDASQALATKKTYYNKANEAYAVQFTAGSGPYGSAGWIMDTIFYQTSQQVSVSRCRGDFAKTYPCGSAGMQMTLFTTTGTATYCPLAAGQVYYVNVRNSVNSSGTDSCPAGKICGLKLELK